MLVQVEAFRFHAGRSQPWEWKEADPVKEVRRKLMNVQQATIATQVWANAYQGAGGSRIEGGTFRQTPLDRKSLHHDPRYAAFLKKLNLPTRNMLCPIQG